MQWIVEHGNEMHYMLIKKANNIDETGYSTFQNSFRILCVFL